MSTREMTLQEQEAVGIYAVMGREPTDAIEMINECIDLEVLNLLYKMLVEYGSSQTDRHLNALIAPSVKRRLDKLNGVIAMNETDKNGRMVDALSHCRNAMLAAKHNAPMLPALLCLEEQLLLCLYSPDEVRAYLASDAAKVYGR